ncbi:MAG TPA: hypothetical protein VIK38_05420 [Coriobacteriia bacterium]
MPDEEGTSPKPETAEPPHRAHTSAGRRRSLLIAGSVVLALIVLVVLPGYFAIQPSFMARYSYLNVEYTTWSQSAHKDVPCQSCHIAPGILDRAGYDARMLGAFYVSLVSPDTKLSAFATPTIAACEVCHADLITTSPNGDLKIPHRAHVDVLQVPCARCHQYLVHQLSPEGKHTPTMATCLVCHDGIQAKNPCSTCHTAKAAPESHAASDWLVIHPQEQTKIDCAKCHGWTTNWCSDCHNRLPASHTADWRTTHGAAVKVHRDCEVCHTGSFCINCHGDVPQLNFDPNVKLVTQ